VTAGARPLDVAWHRPFNGPVGASRAGAKAQGLVGALRGCGGCAGAPHGRWAGPLKPATACFWVLRCRHQWPPTQPLHAAPAFSALEHQGP